MWQAGIILKILRFRMVNTIDSSLHVGWENDMAVEGDYLFISYWDGDNSNLKFIRSTDSGSSWETPVELDTDPFTGRFPQIDALQGKVYILYRSETQNSVLLWRSEDYGVSW